MSGIRGDMAGAKKLADKVRRVVAGGGRAAIVGAFKGAVLKLIADEFRESRDPYGNAWKAPVLRDGKPLLDTGRLRASFTAQEVAGGLAVTTNVKYASTHQYGATIEPVRADALRFQARGKKRFYTLKRSIIPRRQMLPERDTGGIGPIWSATLKSETDKVLRKILG